jgi:hypothetical protein
MGYADFRVADIQMQLDQCAKDFVFPVLDNPMMYLADARLHAYRDGIRWALIIEQLGFMPAAGGHPGINNCLYCFGNCLKRPPGLDDGDFLTVTADGPDGPAFDPDGLYLQPGALSIRIRNQVVPLNLSPAVFQAKGITLEEPPQVKIFEMLRTLLPEQRQLLLATEQELRQRVPIDLPEILTLEQWHHPDIGKGQLPSHSETFRMISKVLVAGDPAFWQPRQQPNSHWKNWPGGGKG